MIPIEEAIRRLEQLRDRGVVKIGDGTENDCLDCLRLDLEWSDGDLGKLKPHYRTGKWDATKVRKERL